MKQVNYIAYLSALIIILSCNKKSISEKDLPNKNQETILFENKLDSAHVSQLNFILGGNTKMVTAIQYSNDILNSVRGSLYVQNLLKTSALDTNNVIRTYLYSSNKLSLVSIPIKGENISSEWLNIYVYDNGFVFTKLSSTRLENGNTKYKVNSITDEIYYTFEVNSKEQIGHWSFVKDIPFMQVFKASNSQAKEDPNGTTDKPCASQSFSQCMNCFIIQVCGSDWVCLCGCATQLYWSCCGCLYLTLKSKQ